MAAAPPVRFEVLAGRTAVRVGMILGIGIGATGRGGLCKKNAWANDAQGIYELAEASVYSRHAPLQQKDRLLFKMASSLISRRPHR